MAAKLSRQELIAIVERLINNEFSNQDEAARNMDRFEANVLFPDAADLIVHWRHEFKNAAELVDFALGQEKVKKLSREELIAVARKLMTGEISNTVESVRLGAQFEANIPHPAGQDLIFYPKINFETAEQLVDYALSYKAPKS